MSSTLRDVWESIRTQPGRVGLSFLAVSIGILALTFLMAVTGGLRERARVMVRELGAQVVAILPPDKANRDLGPPLAGFHADLLANNLPGRDVSAVRRFQVKPEGSDDLLPVLATDEALARVRQWRISAGRFLDRRDIELGERNAVVTRALSHRRDWNLGSVINLQGVLFTVVGIVDGGASASEGESQDIRVQLGDDSVFVPHSVYASWTPSLTGPARAVDAIFVRAAPEESLDHLVRVCKGILGEPGVGASEVSWITPETLLRSIRKLQQTIGFSVGSIAALCLVLGGTTLMSLMLANVRDRVAEIGLRRALGARARDVAILFVLEACAITLGAAVVGTGIAAALLGLAGAFLPAPLRFGPATFLAPVLASFVLGVIFSYWPARTAARVVPAEALRSE